ncbi:hypothetical protein CHUAL_004960 [Chamberlinius hualienensis]
MGPTPVDSFSANKYHQQQSVIPAAKAEYHTIKLIINLTALVFLLLTTILGQNRINSTPCGAQGHSQCTPKT